MPQGMSMSSLLLKHANICGQLDINHSNENGRFDAKGKLVKVEFNRLL